IQDKLDVTFIQKETNNYNVKLIFEDIYHIFFYPDSDAEKLENIETLRVELIEVLGSLPGGDGLIEAFKYDFPYGYLSNTELKEQDIEKLETFHEKIKPRSDIDEIRYEQEKVTEELTDH